MVNFWENIRALATDYDGTIAEEGRVADATVSALQCLRESGRILLLVTGRRLSDLLEIFPQVGLFHRVVAENGALLYDPANDTERLLPNPPPPELLRILRERGVEMANGKVVIGTTRHFDGIALELIDQLHLDLRIIFNKDSAMILPQGVDKGSGMEAALQELGVSWQETAGVGDAENDLDFLGRCGVAIAVANALPEVREQADFVTAKGNGAGVAEVIGRMVGCNFCRMN